jgi:hemerythrin
MSIFEWSDSFLIRIQEIDEHHKHLVGLLNSTYDCFINNANDGEIFPLVDELIKYADYHFEAEEASMEQNNYPFFAEHKLEHERFSEKVQEFYVLLQRGDLQLELEVLQFLKEWLADHILNSDKKFGFYVISKDLSP